QSQFPGINVVRLATSPDGGAFTNGSSDLGGLTPQTVDNINADIKAFNSLGIGVILDDHDHDANQQNNAATGQALSSEESWYQQIAQANAGNNMLMYQTPNEPTGSAQDIVNEQVGIYNTIRSVDSNAFVSFDLEGGGGTNPMTSNAQAYAGMHNVAFDAHFYASDSSDPASSLQQELAPLRSMSDQDGAIPIYIGETGNSIGGSEADPQWQAALDSVWSDGTGGVAWLYDGMVTGAWSNGSNIDTLTNADGSLNSYGQYVARLIQNGAS
ncbi:MAG TPA: cellulase family glycosylhydrolase, partial [Chroococcales cyanobacterium]